MMTISVNICTLLTYSLDYVSNLSLNFESIYRKCFPVVCDDIDSDLTNLVCCSSQLSPQGVSKHIFTGASCKAFIYQTTWKRCVFCNTCERCVRAGLRPEGRFHMSSYMLCHIEEHLLSISCCSTQVAFPLFSVPLQKQQ